MRSAFLIPILSSSLSLAQTADGLVLKVVPSSVELASCVTPARLLVVAKASASRALSAVVLTSFSDAPVQLTPNPPLRPTALGAGEQTSWMFELRCTSTFPAGTLHFVASSKSQIATASVPIKLREPESLDSIAAIDIKSTLESLTQGVKGELVVTATNKTAQAIKIKVIPQVSPSIQLDPQALKDGKALTDAAQIDGGQTATIGFTVIARDRVHPGKQLLLFNVEIESGGLRRNYLLTREVTVGVLGESEMLKLLGIPSLLFLPGFLVMTTFGLLRRFDLWRPANAETTATLTEKDPGYWVISIVLSAAILAGFVARRSDFLSFYGIRDVMYVWLVSIFLGAVAYLLIQTAKYAWAWYSTPQDGDPPTRILQKMGRKNLQMAVPRVDLKGGTKSGLLLRLNPDGSAYVCPHMVLTWKPTFTGDVVATVQNELTSKGSPKVVAAAIKDDLQKKSSSQVARFEWDRSDPINQSAHLVSKEAIEKISGLDIILVEK